MTIGVDNNRPQNLYIYKCTWYNSIYRGLVHFVTDTYGYKGLENINTKMYCTKIYK